MSKQRAWLLGEIDRWKKHELITEEQAAKIRSLYPGEPAAPWGLILFSSFGALVVGLGVILLIAHNWQEIPRLGKVALIVGATTLAHGAAYWFRERGGWKARIGEALFLLGTMFYGAGIWLVAQAYNIDEHFPNGFLLWGLGALALSWAITSTPQIIAAIVLLTVWGLSEGIEFHQTQAWAVGLLIVGIVPLLLVKRSALLAGVWLTALYLLLFTNAAIYGGPALGFTTLLSLSVLLIALARELRQNERYPEAASVTLFFGYTGFFFCANLLSFKELVRDLLGWHWTNLPNDPAAAFYFYSWAFFGAAVLAWLALLRQGQKSRARLFTIEEWLCPIALVYAQVIAVKNFYSDASFVAGVFKIVFAAMAVMWMLRGCQSGSLRKTVVGSVLFSIWIFARYFDLFDSLASRGIAFLFLGVALFAEGLFYRRLRQDETKGNS